MERLWQWIDDFGPYAMVAAGLLMGLAVMLGTG